LSYKNHSGKTDVKLMNDPSKNNGSFNFNISISRMDIEGQRIVKF